MNLLKTIYGGHSLVVMVDPNVVLNDTSLNVNKTLNNFYSSKINFDNTLNETLSIMNVNKDIITLKKNCLSSRDY